MRSPFLVLAAALCLPASASAQTQHLAGYVTAIDPSGAFDLEGIHVRLTPATRWETRVNSSTVVTCPAPATLYLGQTLDATGPINNSTHTLSAAEILLVSPATASISGTAIIDLIPPAPATGQPATDRLVRADGYLLRITEKTKLNFSAPLKTLSDIATNQWIDYNGIQQLDGTVLLNYAGIGRNAVTPSEDKLRRKNEYDPAAVTDADRQSGASKFFLGTDSRRIPAYPNEDMLARVQRIGASLIPAYQRDLPDADPTKIHFRFQVIDSTKWRDAVTVPSGVIVIPHQVVERMQNDSQLATILADNIAEAIEKDAYRFVPTAHKVGAANIAGTVAGVFIPGVGLATSIAGSKVTNHVLNLQLQQSGRVSLDLLHDAGYDITQAPIAWWLLSPKFPKPIAEVQMPPRAATLYMSLGTTWHPTTPPTPTPASK